MSNKTSHSTYNRFIVEFANNDDKYLDVKLDDQSNSLENVHVLIAMGQKSSVEFVEKYSKTHFECIVDEEKIDGSAKFALDQMLVEFFLETNLHENKYIGKQLRDFQPDRC